MNPKDYLSPAEYERYVELMKKKNPDYNPNHDDGLEAIMEKEERLLELARRIGL